MLYVIYDPRRRGFWRSHTKVVASPREAKAWGQLSAAVTKAAIANRSRNVPPGQEPSAHHRDLPNFVVRGYDESWTCRETHAAPPIYLIG